jgi:hypothetical protein
MLRRSPQLLTAPKWIGSAIGFALVSGTPAVVMLRVFVIGGRDAFIWRSSEALGRYSRRS